MKITMTESEYTTASSDHMGICLNCQQLNDGVEPDAENYTCEACDAEEVCGLEHALLSGFIKIKSDYGKFEDEES